MQDATIIKAIEGKYIELLDDLDERGRRRWAAVEARALGHGGITTVALATGLSDRTIRTGLKELDNPVPLAGHRQRQSGGGRKSHAITQPGLQDALDRLIEPTVRGSPTNPLRWTIKSTHRLAQTLRKQGYEVSATSVRRMLVAMKYSLQGNRKTREGVQHPDRDGQFHHIAERVKARKRRGEPALVGKTGSQAVWQSQTVVGDGGQRWQQQFAEPFVESGVAEVGGRDGTDRRGQPRSTRNQQMEQDRASVVLPHYAELAGDTSGDVGDRG
jgi:Rhodopirellula transposase DDE domain